MQQNMSSIKESLIQINICVLLLGGTSLFAKLISLPADTITLYRSTFGFLTLLVIVFITRSTLRLESVKDYAFMIFSGLLLGAHWVTYFHSIQISTVAIGIVSLYTFPIMTSLMEPIIEREKIKYGSILRATMVLIGIILIIPEFGFTNQTTAGVLWGLVSAAFISARNIMVRKVLSHVSGITTMCYQLAVICTMLIPLVSYRQDLMVENRLTLLILLGIIFTAAPHVLLVASLRHLKAATASLILCLHPMYSIVFAAVVISEMPGMAVLIGGLIIVSISLYETLQTKNNNKVSIEKKHYIQAKPSEPN